MGLGDWMVWWIDYGLDMIGSDSNSVLRAKWWYVNYLDAEVGGALDDGVDGRRLC